MQTKIPVEFWAELKSLNLIEQNAPAPVSFDIKNSSEMSATLERFSGGFS
jgi:hypothetical protein